MEYQCCHFGKASLVLPSCSSILQTRGREQQRPNLILLAPLFGQRKYSCPKAVQHLQQTPVSALSQHFHVRWGDQSMYCHQWAPQHPTAPMRKLREHLLPNIMMRTREVRRLQTKDGAISKSLIFAAYLPAIKNRIYYTLLPISILRLMISTSETIGRDCAAICRGQIIIK